jgi:hypothetical protein
MGVIKQEVPIYSAEIITLPVALSLTIPALSRLKSYGHLVIN